MSIRFTGPYSNASAAGVYRIPLITALPMLPSSIGHSGSSLKKVSFEAKGFDAMASSGRAPSAGRLAVFADARATDPEDGVAIATPREDVQMEAAGVVTPSTALIVSLLLIGGVFSIKSVLDFFKSKREGGEREDPLKNPTGRPTVREEISDEDPLRNPTGRPTVAATPEALKGKRPSFGVRIGGESIPGASIIPPPAPKGGSGGSNIQ